MSKFCPHCGAAAMENTRFCDNCGNMIEQPQQNAPPPEPPPQYTPQPEPPPQYAPPPEPLPQYTPQPEPPPQYAPPPEPPSQYAQPEPPQQYAPPPEPPQQYAPPPEPTPQYAPPQQYAPPEPPSQYAPPQQPQYQQPQYQQQYAPPGGPPEPSGAKRKFPLWGIIAIIIAGLGVLVGAIILVVSLLSGTMGKTAEADYYEIGSDKVPSVKYVLGEIREVTGVSTSTRNGVTTKTIEYRVPDNQGAEMLQYAKALMDKHGFYNTTPYDFTGSTGKGFEFSRVSDTEGFIIMLEIEYDRSGYTIKLTRGEGTLTIPETAPEPEPEDTPEPDSTPEPEDTPEPGDTSDEEEMNQGTLPGSGGTTTISGSTELTFTAEYEGLWTFHTLNSGDDDPHMYMVLLSGDVYHDDDDGMGDNNSLIYVYLDAGMTVSIIVMFYDPETLILGYESGSTTIIAKPPIDLPPGGGEIQVTAPQGYMFTPDKSGTYEFRTSNNGDGDPYLLLHDFGCENIASDDDSGGDLNAMFTVELEAGEEYHLYAAFSTAGPIDYTLTITLK